MATGVEAHRGRLVSGRFPELEEALCERVTELQRGRSLHPVHVVVGSAAVRTRVQDLLVRRLGAFANVDVTTIARFAAGLARTSGTPVPPVVAGIVRERLLRAVADDAAARLGYFGPVLERPHFAQALAATFADLREALVPADADWSPAAGAPTPAGAGRAADLAGLYRGYCDALGRLGATDGAGLLAVAAAAGAPAGATILYGFYDLNRAQERLVETLLDGGADVFVPVPRGVAASGAVAGRAALARGLRDDARRPPPTVRDRDRLAAVWLAPGAGPGTPLQLAGDGTLAVVSVPDERAELREAARAVVNALQEGAYAWDVAVLVPHGDDIEPAVATLRAAGLPVACRVRDRSAGLRVLIRLADCLAPPAGRPFARRAVVDLLTAAPPARSGDAAEAALWLDEARQAGVVAGASQWAERLRARRAGLERRLADAEALATDDMVDDEDEAASSAASVRRRLAAARGLEGASLALVQACDRLPRRASWPAWAEGFATVAAAVFDAETAAQAADAAARLGALAVLGEDVELDEAAAMLREVLDGGRMPLGRVGRHGVAVLTPLDARGLSFHTVVFTGLAEGGFPVRGRPDPLLGDAERRRLASALDTRLPLAEQRDAESLLVFALACEAARERLALLAPRSSAADGRPRLPSRLLLRLAHLGAGKPVGMDDFLRGVGLGPVWRRVGASTAAGADPVWVDQRERDAAQLLAMSEAGRTGAARDYAVAVLGGPASARRLGAWRAARSPQPGAWDGLFGEAARADLAARHPFAAEMHPTRLERYIGCPFAFLLRDVYGLDAPDEPGDSLEMDAKEFGTLAHAILQGTYERVMEETLDLDGARRALDVVCAQRCDEAERRGVTGAALSWEVRRDTLRQDLHESLRRDRALSEPDRHPVGIEWRFGTSAGRPVAAELAGGRLVRFAGRLDRVDEVPGGAVVIDYKSGAGSTERGRIKERLSVQLPVYALALRQAGGADYGTITCLYRLVTRRGDFQDLALPQSEAESTRRLRELVQEAVALVDAGMFPRTTRQRCEYCDVRYACGVSAWSRARKREHPALDAVVHLQSPPPEVPDDD